MGIGRYTGDISQVCNSAALASGNSTQLLPLGKRIRLKKITLTETDLNFELRDGSADGTLVCAFATDRGAGQAMCEWDFSGSGLLFTNGVNLTAKSASLSNLASFCLYYEG